MSEQYRCHECDEETINRWTRGESEGIYHEDGCKEDSDYAYNPKQETA